MMGTAPIIVNYKAVKFNAESALAVEICAVK